MISITLFSRVHASHVSQAAISYQLSAFFLNHCTKSGFLTYFPFSCSVLSFFYVNIALHVVCLYAYRNPFSLILLCICICLLGCICTVLKVNLLYLSRKLFLTAILPDGFLSISPQLLKKFYFLKPYEFSFTVLHNSMY